MHKSLADRVVELAKAKKPLGIKCNRCGSEEITEITYGLPAWITIDEPVDARIQSLIDERFIVLGGCCVRKDSPKYFCRSCKNKF